MIKDDDFENDNIIKTSENKVMNKLFKFKGSPTKSMDNEIEQHLTIPTTKDEESDIISWWNLNSIQFPKLSSLAAEVVNCLAPSVDSEVLRLLFENF